MFTTDLPGHPQTLHTSPNYATLLCSYFSLSTAIDEHSDEFDDDDDLDSIDMEECYVVTRDYTKLSMDELDVYEGQMVCIIDDSDRG